jgi:GDPmannose 4,6-dehydratase
MKRALITGITGQDGAYLGKYLLSQGYEVHGTSRLPASERFANLEFLCILNQVRVHKADTARVEDVRRVLEAVCPTEVYHLAGQSSVALSFDEPAVTVSSILQGTINLLEAIRIHYPETRFYHSASSEMFGGDAHRPYSELDPFHPKSPYAVGKSAAYWSTASYREAYGLFACSGILFNHESPLRSKRFVTRKITSAVAQIKAGLADELRLGDLSIQRDWGYAPEYVEAMWMMLQEDAPRDYVICTGEVHSLQEFVELAFDETGLDWRKHTMIAQDLFRPNEVRCSAGDPTRANQKLGWKARTTFRELVALMVRHDMTLIQRGKAFQ